MKRSEKRIGRVRLFCRRLFARKIVILGAVLVAIFVIGAIFAPLLTPYDPYAQDYTAMMAPPSGEHLLGTDQLGRDILTRLLYGARTSLLIGVVAVGIAATLGILLGAIAGYVGGWVGAVILQVTDAIRTVPSIMLALALCLIFEKGTFPLMLILGLSTIPGYVRMMYAQTLSIRNSDYINAVKLLGAGAMRTMFKHVIPNCISPIIVMLTTNIGSTILAESSLSFLGFGVVAPTASWGAMVNEGYKKMLAAPLFGITPGACIILLVLGLNILGDGLRDVLDPRLRGSI